MDPRIDDLRALLRDDPGSRRFFQLGELLRKEGELVEAESVLTSGLEIHPRYVAAWISLGRIQFAITRWAEAEKSYAHALELDPENAVAARLIGETAEEQRQWERAHKAYQLAHMLSGRDPELAAKISEMERRIAGDESYDAPTEPDVMLPPAYQVPQAMQPELDLLEETEEVFEEFLDESESESESESEPEPEFSPAPLQPRRSREVVTFSDDDPFAVRAAGDTGVFLLGDDVFATPQPEPEPAEAPDAIFYSEDLPVAQEDVALEVEPETRAAADEVFEEVFDVEEIEETALAVKDSEPLAAAADIEPETWAGGEDAVEEAEEIEQAMPAVEGFEPLAAATDIEPDTWAGVEDVVEAAETYPAGAEDDQGGLADVPLPTLTLARLAVDQDDVDLARRTLRSLLARNPGDDEALMMLEELDGRPAVSPAQGADQLVMAQSLPVAKATALRGWLDAIRLAAERRSP